jgi:hypothetical protein
MIIINLIYRLDPGTENNLSVAVETLVSKNFCFWVSVNFLIGVVVVNKFFFASVFDNGALYIPINFFALFLKPFRGLFFALFLKPLRGLFFALFLKPFRELFFALFLNPFRELFFALRSDLACRILFFRIIFSFSTYG